MVKKEKVILMTRLAIEEKTDPRYRFITGSFWFDDYASKELWEAFFAISFAYALVVILGLIAYGDCWTVTYHIADAMELARILLMIWLLLQVREQLLWKSSKNYPLWSIYLFQ